MSERQIIKVSPEPVPSYKLEICHKVQSRRRSLSPKYAKKYQIKEENEGNNVNRNIFKTDETELFIDNENSGAKHSFGAKIETIEILNERNEHYFTDIVPGGLADRLNIREDDEILVFCQKAVMLQDHQEMVLSFKNLLTYLQENGKFDLVIKKDNIDEKDGKGDQGGFIEIEADLKVSEKDGIVVEEVSKLTTRFVSINHVGTKQFFIENRQYSRHYMCADESGNVKLKPIHRNNTEQYVFDVDASFGFTGSEKDPLWCITSNWSNKSLAIDGESVSMVERENEREERNRLGHRRRGRPNKRSTSEIHDPRLFLARRHHQWWTLECAFKRDHYLSCRKRGNFEELDLKHVNKEKENILNVPSVQWYIFNPNSLDSELSNDEESHNSIISNRVDHHHKRMNEVNHRRGTFARRSNSVSSHGHGWNSFEIDNDVSLVFNNHAALFVSKNEDIEEERETDDNEIDGVNTSEPNGVNTNWETCKEDMEKVDPHVMDKLERSLEKCIIIDKSFL